MFGAALLAKATDSRVDALSLKIRHSPSAYAIRSVAEKVLVPASVDPARPFDLAVRGPSPTNNQPWFRYEHMDEMLAVRGSGRPYIDLVIAYLRRLNRMDPIDAQPAALGSLAAFLRRRIQIHDARESLDLSGSGLSLAGALRVCDAFLAATDDIPKRAQALVAGVYDVAFGPEAVASGRVNDPSRHGVGDVRVYDGNHLLMSVEVRKKPVELHDALIFVNRCREEGVSRAHIIAFAQHHNFDRTVLAAEAIKGGVLVFVAETPEQLLRSTLSHATADLADMLRWLPDRVRQRLDDIEASPVTLAHWQELCGSDAAST